MSTFLLELPDSLMEEAKAAAAEDKVSLNDLLATFIGDGIGQRRALLDLIKRGRVADLATALAILERVPTVASDKGRRVASSAAKASEQVTPLATGRLMFARCGVSR